MNANELIRAVEALGVKILAAEAPRGSYHSTVMRTDHLPDDGPWRMGTFPYTNAMLRDRDLRQAVASHLAAEGKIEPYVELEWAR